MSSAACSSKPPLANAYASPEALAADVLGAMRAGDRARLEAIALNEQEFKDHVWPDLPAARPERNLPFSYVWGDLRQKSQMALSVTLKQHTGQRYELRAVRFSGTRRFTLGIGCTAIRCFAYATALAAKTTSACVVRCSRRTAPGRSSATSSIDVELALQRLDNLFLDRSRSRIAEHAQGNLAAFHILAIDAHQYLDVTHAAVSGHHAGDREIGRRFTRCLFGNLRDSTRGKTGFKHS